MHTVIQCVLADIDFRDCHTGGTHTASIRHIPTQNTELVFDTSAVSVCHLTWITTKEGDSKSGTQRSIQYCHLKLKCQFPLRDDGWERERKRKGERDQMGNWWWSIIDWCWVLRKLFTLKSHSNVFLNPVGNWWIKAIREGTIWRRWSDTSHFTFTLCCSPSACKCHTGWISLDSVGCRWTELATQPLWWLLHSGHSIVFYAIKTNIITGNCDLLTLNSQLVLLGLRTGKRSVMGLCFL